MYRIGVNQIGFSAGNSKKLTISPDSIDSTVPITATKLTLSTQPFLNRYNSNTQSITDGVVTNITQNTQEDPDVDITNLTNQRWLINTDGIYNISGQVMFPTAVSAYGVDISIMITDVEKRSFSYTVSTAHELSATYNYTCKLLSTDDIRVRMVQNSGGTIVTGATGPGSQKYSNNLTIVKLH